METSREHKLKVEPETLRFRSIRPIPSFTVRKEDVVFDHPSEGCLLVPNAGVRDEIGRREERHRVVPALEMAARDRRSRTFRVPNRLVPADSSVTFPNTGAGEVAGLEASSGRADVKLVCEPR